MKKEVTKFRMKKPGYHRRTFSISVKEPDGPWKVFKNKKTESLNQDYIDGISSFSKTLEGFEELMKAMYQERDSSKKTALNANVSIRDEYYAFKYLKPAKKRRLAKETLKSSFYDLTRAITAVGNVNLRIATCEEIQNEIDAYYTKEASNTPHEKSIMRINALLKFIGRADQANLETLPKSHKEVNHLTRQEFITILNELEGVDKDLASIAYYSGLRLGEIFGLEKRKIRRIQEGFVILVDRQMLRDFSYELPKRRKVRRCFANPECQDALKRWVELSHDERTSYRRRKFCFLIKQACKTSETKHILSFRDLRHCYAINLLNSGATLSQVASNLGNSEKVCRDHYLGWVMTNEGVELMAKTISYASCQNNPF